MGDLSNKEKERILKSLPALNRQLERERMQRDDYHQNLGTPGTEEHSRSEWLKLNQPEWETLEGNLILRIPGQPLAALPMSGKKSSPIFVIFDVKKRQEIIQLKKSEVASWLVREAEGHRKKAAVLRLYEYVADDGTIYWSLTQSPMLVSPPTRLLLQDRKGLVPGLFLHRLRLHSENAPFLVDEG